MEYTSYTEWVLAGNTSEHLDRVRAALDGEPRSRKEVAELAGVSRTFADQAVATLVALGEVQMVGARRTKGHPEYLYAPSSTVVVQRG